MMSTTMAKAGAALFVLPILSLTLVMVLLALVSLIPNRSLRLHVCKLIRLLTVAIQAIAAAPGGAGTRS